MNWRKLGFELDKLRQVGGYACPISIGLIEIKGQDAGRFLQKRATSDILSLQSGQGQPSCILDRKAHVQALFSIHRLGDSYLIVAENEQIPSIIKQLEQYLFNEKVEIIDRSNEGKFFAVQGTLARKVLCSILSTAQLPSASKLFVAEYQLDAKPVIVVASSITGDEGYLLWCQSGGVTIAQDQLIAQCKEYGLEKLSVQVIELARIESGILCYGVDVSMDNLLPETGLAESVVSFTKGCYVGQEVIARITTFGAPRQGLTGIMFPQGCDLSFPLNEPVFYGDKQIGQLKSNVFSPHFDCTIAYAYLLKEHLIPDQNLRIRVGEQTFLATTKLLPFYKAPSAQDKAKQLYEQALHQYATGDEVEAVGNLKGALILDPSCGDIYEMLGVILSKQDQLDEAIGLMKKLAEVSPDSIMAHANLSVFYMQQGNKEAAEEEKALAMSMRMSQAAREMTAKRQHEESEEHKKEEAKQRIAMFEAVLAIDADDLLANYGLGNIHVELKQYKEAIPYLMKAIEVKENHSVAYLALGRAFQGLGEIEKAVATYGRGIDIASKRGDMTPLKDMQLHLSQLQSGSKLTGGSHA